MKQLLEVWVGFTVIAPKQGFVLIVTEEDNKP